MVNFYFWSSTRVFSNIVYVSISLSNIGVIFRINFTSQIPIQLDTSLNMGPCEGEEKEQKKKGEGIGSEWVEAQDTLSV